MIKSPELSIKTPEGVIFSLELAGPVHRFMAAVIDLGCMFAILSSIVMILNILEVLNHDIAGAGIILSSFVIMLGYGIVLEWFWRGQTLGKHIMNLRVMDINGLKLNFSQVVIRNLLRAVDSMPVYYMFGGICSIISPKRQRLGDLAANTVVVRAKNLSSPDIGEVLGDKYNSFLAYPHLAARLRQKATPEEASLALQALLRRDTLQDNARVKLFESLAGHLKSIVAFPEEATSMLSDEQYVKNAVEILFRHK